MEGTTARELHAHGNIAAHVKQFPLGDGGLSDIGELVRSIHPLCASPLQVSQEW